MRDTLVLRVTASGEAAAWRRATMNAQVQGRIMELLVRENQRVVEDALLLAVDDTEYQLNVETAEAGLRQA
ncbi:MAG: biotin/lipoyl-binding protein, partial [Gemmatimonadetes bacterium]|nr:biotin/lipoyl-binding protein [Gemmatimonadota bacterium]NIQ59458.1 biotin/lipoyl-binding protein [Gemmatimonadota bacterium]NIU79644.1 biotin/lipoyl-binding protein [Gammaproteobacteria bacterium]NIX40239.1 biotin/lipoyl-binding protein [Gemmatimonadota bacterium]NIX48213.1 biotin/lipoyl-binding protein [Gemmatimonadota bacterium]